MLEYDNTTGQFYEGEHIMINNKNYDKVIDQLLNTLYPDIKNIIKRG